MPETNSPRTSRPTSPRKTRSFARWMARCARWLWRIPRPTPARTLPCLLLCASCAATPSAPEPPEACFIPRTQLEPTPVPPLQDETYGDLRKEANETRKALEKANSDKAIALQLLEKQNQQRRAPENGSKP